MNTEKNVTDLSPSPSCFNDSCNHIEHKKDEIPCLVFTFGSDQPSRILQKTYQSDNVPIFQHASRKQWEKTVIVILLLSWGIEARKKKKKLLIPSQPTFFLQRPRKYKQNGTKMPTFHLTVQKVHRLIVGFPMMKSIPLLLPLCGLKFL